MSKVIKSIGIINVGDIYTITEGEFVGKSILIEWISPNKQIHIGNNQMRRQVYGKLLNSNKRINTILEFLKEYIDLKNSIRIKNMSDFDLIKLCKKDNKNAIKEFVRRFKKLPKFNAIK